MSIIRNWLKKKYCLSFVETDIGGYAYFDRPPTELEIAIFIEKYFTSGTYPDGGRVHVKIEEIFCLK